MAYLRSKRSSMHACAKCGCTVFTLERPKSNIGGNFINTGIKLATCMECGSQDRPKEVEELAAKQAKDAEAKRQEELWRISSYDYERLLAKWLRSFEYYARGGTSE